MQNHLGRNPFQKQNEDFSAPLPSPAPTTDLKSGGEGKASETLAAISAEVVLFAIKLYSLIAGVTQSSKTPATPK